MTLAQSVQQIVNPVVVDKVIGAKKVSPAKLLSNKKKDSKKKDVKASRVVSEITTLRAELKTLSGAVVSPMMTIEQLKTKVEEFKNPKPVVEVKERVIPSKPQGIGNFVVTQLKAKVTPKDVLVQVKEKFPSAKTSMACVYWYASKINQGLL